MQRPETASPVIASFACRSEHFDAPWYRYWAERIAENGAELDRFGPEFAQTFAKVWDAMTFDANGWPLYRHRKMWEWCAIAQALHERGQLRPGARGCGFAVGHEPLASLFAARGTTVLATDLGADDDDADWGGSGQQTSERDQLWWPNIVAKRDFDERVTFRPVDMRRMEGLEADAFDFVWSSCSLEHLGTLENGFEFVERSADLLKPGGLAVHTTEFNLDSDRDTVEEGWTVIYRERDLTKLAERLARRGASIDSLDFRRGDRVEDLNPDEPPYYENDRAHVTLKLEGFTATSIALIVRKNA